MLSSCRLTKYVPDGQFLLDNNSIQFVNDSLSNERKIDLDDLNSILKQQPNRKNFIGLPFSFKVV